MSSVTTSGALPLGEWQNFYVLLGSSAGALTGLTFIVITVAADSSGFRNAAVRLAGLRAFITPTAVYFGSALAVSALMSIPGQTAFTLAVCLAVSGAGGLTYWGTVIRWMFRATSDYSLFLADWIWSVILPALSYAALVACALLLRVHAPASLYVVAATTLLLLFIGIHNAWDVVVWITTERHARREYARGSEPPDPPPAEQSPPAESFATEQSIADEPQRREQHEHRPR
ncbi:MAG TPA: hypothetical protein VMU40_16105 [Steroidobacteraceae bacterium]|nr:hypothetical protein [Steroidobacteraceae bacterium]